MRQLQLISQGIFAFAFLVSVHAQSNTNGIIGQWDFNTNDVTAATIGAPLQLVGGIQGTFQTNQVNGRDAGVMRLPRANPDQGLLAAFNPIANGGGTNLNQYTVLMDVMWPSESDFSWRALFNASTNNTDDADMFVNPDNMVGVVNDYALEVPANQWHRLVIVANLTNNTITRYLDGNLTTAAPLTVDETGVDTRYSLNGGILFFADNDNETAPVILNSLQLRSRAMTATEVAALGRASSAGLGGEADPVPVGDVKIEGISRSGSNVTITVEPGRTVQLQQKVQLSDGGWQNVGLPSAAGTFTVPMATPTAFFRLEIR